MALRISSLLNEATGTPIIKIIVNEIVNIIFAIVIPDTVYALVAHRLPD